MPSWCASRPPNCTASVRQLNGAPGGVLPRRVAVLGAGTIGLMALQVARAAGATLLFCVDVDSERLAVAQRLGATATLHPRQADSVQEGLALTAGQGFDAVFDAVGRAQTRAASLRLVRVGGTAVWIGSAEDETALSGQQVVLGERRVQGAYAYTDLDFAAALDLLAAGRVETESWSRTYPLSQGAELFTRLLEHREPCIKALLRPGA